MGIACAEIKSYLCSLMDFLNRWFGLLSLLLFFSVNAAAQCTNPIRTYPYLENFENTDGGFRSSNANFWKWGTPTANGRTILTQAGNGQKCWTVGGFSGRSYPGGSATLTSPCFDLSTLTNPVIAFKVLWETETSWDGIKLEYSINQGTTWSALGNDLSNNNCRGINWYNNDDVDFLNTNNSNSPIIGWSGSVLRGTDGNNCSFGQGSSTWLESKHKLIGLAGNPKVIFRFFFGSGTNCNAYDGFGVDDFTIQEGGPDQADGSFECRGNREVIFTNNPPFCQRSVSWNFDDLNSGTTNNTSVLEQPSHVFSTQGLYTVTQTVTFNNNTTSTKFYQINILDATVQQTTQIRCAGDRTANLAAQVNGGNGPYQYSWNNNPNLNGQTLSNLGPGYYFVTVTAPNACSDSAGIRIIEPNPIELDSSIDNEVCRQSNGSIDLQIQGGTEPYRYTWNNGATGPSISGIRAGSYVVVVKDANDCVYNSGFMVVQNTDVPAQPFLGNDTLICNNETLVLNPGNFSDYRWQDNTTRPTFTVQTSGRYFVEVRNAAGCTGSDTISVSVDCKGVFIPNAFSPNGNGLNETFGPIGDLALMRNYSLNIYNRFGQALFQSVDPAKRWDGKFKGKPSESGTYTWQMKYRLNGGKETLRKGTLILLR